MSALMYHLKCALNILATLILIVGGILIILLAWIIPSSPPFAVLGHVKPLELILAGSTLIIISLSPLVVAVNTINLRQGYNRRWQRQTIRELGGILQEPIKSRKPSHDNVFIEDEITNDVTETLKYCQSETLVQMVQDPMAQWKGEDVHSLIKILAIDEQGNLRYPHTHPIPTQVPESSVVLSNDQAVRAGTDHTFNPETVHYQKLESLVEVVNNPDLISGQTTAASLIDFLHLDQLGTLRFPSFSPQNN